MFLEHYKVKKHIEDCIMQYITMFLLLALGLSSGAWFYSLSGSDFFFSGAVILVLCKSVVFWECFFILFCRCCVLYIVLLCCSINRVLSFLGYVIVFVCGVSLGSFVASGQKVDILSGIVIFIIQLMYCMIIMYLNAINTCKDGFLAPSKGGVSRKGKIYISSFAFTMFYVFISGLLVFALNMYI